MPSYSLKTILRRLGVSADDDVLMHVNAEGGEFLAIPPAIADGSLCRLVDHLTIDLHYTYFRGAKTRTVFTAKSVGAYVWLRPRRGAERRATAGALLGFSFTRLKRQRT